MVPKIHRSELFFTINFRSYLSIFFCPTNPTRPGTVSCVWGVRKGEWPGLVPPSRPQLVPWNGNTDRSRIRIGDSLLNLGQILRRVNEQCVLDCTGARDTKLDYN